MSVHDHDHGLGHGGPDGDERMPEPRRAALKQLLLDQVAAEAPPARPLEPAAPLRRPVSRRYARHLAAAASLATLAGLGGAALLGLTGNTAASAETVHCYTRAPDAAREHAVRSVAIEVPVLSGPAGRDGTLDAGLAAREACIEVWSAGPAGVLAAVPDAVANSAVRTIAAVVACRDAVGTVVVFPGVRGDCERHGFGII